ncbi:D-glycero-alpha-D-manno-heptose-1,7-bisphosphate 7-phosphatase [Cupriavidus sp. AU9028]|uniref:D-glycero-alpha-D-manno-heptose-1,7-bisphosphate 7-phosphatase n=1 Tax=Cupriavidus sp. AU9028 TaxID=2871157 RepID=UPI00351D9D2E
MNSTVSGIVPGRRTGAVLLDKDGTIVEDVPYNVDPAQMRFAPGAAAALRRLGQLGVPLVVVSNQPGVALGRFGPHALAAVRQRLAAMFEEQGARLAGFFFCPHHPAGAVPRFTRECACRKPMPGLLRQAAALMQFDLRQSWMIGDILNDVEAGKRAGCHTILVDCGNETEWVPGPLRKPDHVVRDLDEAAAIVIQHFGGPLPAAERSGMETT